MYPNPDGQINADSGPQLAMYDVHDRYAQPAYFKCLGSRIESYLCNFSISFILVTDCLSLALAN